MGWRGLFRREQPLVMLRVEDVHPWLKRYQDSLGLDHHFSIFTSEMKQHVKHALERLDVLESADLQNPNIPERAKNVLVGHRKQYAKRIKDFLEEIEIPNEYERLSGFAESFSERLERLSAETQRSVFVLKEFLEKEAGSVARAIGDMDRSITDLRSTFERLGKDRVDRAYLALHKHHELLERREHLGSALVQERDRLKEPEEKLRKIECKIDEYTTGRGYRLVKEREEEFVKVEGEFSAAKLAVMRVASPAQKAMKKAQKRVADEGLLSMYLDDFSLALIGDGDLKIVQALKEVEKSLDDIGLKEAVRDRARKSLERMSASWLEEQRVRLSDLSMRASSLQASIGKDTTRLLIDEQRRWHASTKEHLDDIQRNIEVIEGELERLSPRLSLQKVRDSLRELHEKLDLEELQGGR